MFTADVPGVARSASGEMARTAESRLCLERQDRGSGRRDLVFVNRELTCWRDAKGRLRPLTPEERELVEDPRRRDAAFWLGIDVPKPGDVETVVRHELVPPSSLRSGAPRRHAVALPDLEALRDRFRR